MTFTVPAEWAPHRAMWLGFPSHAELWEDDLAAAQGEVAALARALAGPGGERVRLLTGSPAGRGGRALAAGRRGGDRVVPASATSGYATPARSLARRATPAQGFRFNGWGQIRPRARTTRSPSRSPPRRASLARNDFILEGGAVDHDGEGTVLTTGQCLLNPNRNPGWTLEAAEAALASSLGARRCCGWAPARQRRPHRRPRGQSSPASWRPASSPCRSPGARRSQRQGL